MTTKVMSKSCYLGGLSFSAAVCIDNTLRGIGFVCLWLVSVKHVVCVYWIWSLVQDSVEGIHQNHL